MPIHQRLLLLNQMAGLFHKWQGKRQKGITVKVLKVLPPASVQVVKKERSVPLICWSWGKLGIFYPTNFMPTPTNIKTGRQRVCNIYTLHFTNVTININVLCFEVKFVQFDTFRYSEKLSVTCHCFLNQLHRCFGFPGWFGNVLLGPGSIWLI